MIQQLHPGVHSRETLPMFIGRSVYYRLVMLAQGSEATICVYHQRIIQVSRVNANHQTWIYQRYWGPAGGPQ